MIILFGHLMSWTSFIMLYVTVVVSCALGAYMLAATKENSRKQLTGPKKNMTGMQERLASVPSTPSGKVDKVNMVIREGRRPVTARNQNWLEELEKRMLTRYVFDPVNQSVSIRPSTSVRESREAWIKSHQTQMRNKLLGPAANLFTFGEEARKREEAAHNV